MSTDTIVSQWMMSEGYFIFAIYVLLTNARRVSPTALPISTAAKTTCKTNPADGPPLIIIITI